MFLDSSTQKGEEYELAEGNLQIDLLGEERFQSESAEQESSPSKNLSSPTTNVMLSPVAQVIVGSFTRLPAP